MSASAYLAIGQQVKVDGWGLNGLALRVKAMFLNPEHRFSYRLEVVRTGKTLPGRYDERLITPTGEG